MRRFILLVLIGAFLTENVTSSKIHEYSHNLKWLFGLNDESNDKEESRTVCQIQECDKMAKLLLGNMNKSVNPCDDFYEYACGRWVENNPIPESNNRWNAMAVLQSNVNQQIRDILEAEPADDDIRSVKLAKQWYKSCMDTNEMEKQELQPLVSTLSRIGGWPMIMGPDEWDEQEYSWQKVDDHYMRLTGRNSFHDVRVEKIENIFSDYPDKTVYLSTPHLPPGSKKLRSERNSDSDKKEDGSDEDPSDEEKQSDEGNSQEPGSEGEDHSKNVENNVDNDDDNDNGSNDSDDDDDDDEDDDDSDDDTNEQDDDEDAKKKISKKKTTGKIGHKKNRKLGGQKKSGSRITKHKNHRMRKQRVKRRAIPTKVDSKRAQRIAHRKKSHPQKNKKNHAKKVQRRERKKKILNSTKAMHTTLRVNAKKIGKNEATTRQQYADYISKVARIIAKESGTEVSQENLDKDIADMIDFQLKLIDIIPESASSKFDMLLEAVLSWEVTLDDFQEWYDKEEPKTDNSKINWVYKIAALFDEAYVSINGDLNLEVALSNYFASLIPLLDETSSRTIVNYVHWNFISRIISATTSEMRELYKSWKNDNKEKTTSSQRMSICANSAEMQDILAYAFVKKYFSDDIVQTASDMLDGIEKEVGDLIKKSDWMDDDAKEFALAKLTNLKKLIGYPDWYRNDTILESYLEGLIVGNSYYENELSFSRYTKWKGLRKLTEDYTNGKLTIDPTIVNAFFLPLKNALVLAAADFQSPFFAYSRPQSINFGIIGFIMAHEVNHGFDNHGHLFDKDGTYMGWLSDMAGAYDKKADCFIQQFNNYPVDEKSNKTIKDYGEQTESDNIADTMGLQAIFKAYRRKERESEKSDAALPGMEEFTSDQLFFLSFANLWCEAFKSEDIVKEAKSDEHSTGRLRVIGAVSNSEDFAKAYNCPAGSQMNPEKKCNIWGNDL